MDLVLGCGYAIVRSDAASAASCTQVCVSTTSSSRTGKVCLNFQMSISITYFGTIQIANCWLESAGYSPCRMHRHCRCVRFAVRASLDDFGSARVML